jgi:Zn finger protein HypA/HybF involved in hydrogenase expression
MHMSCFTEYRRGHSYTCPLCMRSMDDMKGRSYKILLIFHVRSLTNHLYVFFVDYFAMLDAAVRMQPMPAAYLTTKSNIYCQDCGKTGQVQYHFVGLKCSDCGSYNTREMGRVDCSDEVR